MLLLRTGVQGVAVSCERITPADCGLGVMPTFVDRMSRQGKAPAYGFLHETIWGQVPCTHNLCDFTWSRPLVPRPLDCLMQQKRGVRVKHHVPLLLRKSQTEVEGYLAHKNWRPL